MIFFCEECGQRMQQVQGDAGTGPLFQCPGCHESRHGASGEMKGMGWFGASSSRSSSSQEPREHPLNVLVVDDSGLLRKAIRSMLESDSRIRVIGEAANGAQALELIPRINPDVITLDINMPVMDGMTALKHIMIKFPKPTVMFSTLTREGAWISLDALKYGAVDFLDKPSQMDLRELDSQRRTIIEKVKNAAKVRTDSIRLIRTGVFKDKPIHPANSKPEAICAIGAGEGGYGALLKLIPRLQPDLPAALIIVIHAPEEQVTIFAQYLSENSPMIVRRAQDGDRIRSGTCYLVSGSEYATIESLNGDYRIRTCASPFPQKRGAINMLMLSLSETLPVASMGIVLTGDGEDAAEGTEELIRSGGRVMIQDPDTCLFNAMSLRAIERCPEARVVPINRMADEIIHTLMS